MLQNLPLRTEVPSTYMAMMGVQVPGGGGRAGAIESAAKVWSGQLVDLAARNNLLFYRDLKVGTLDLGGVAPRRDRGR